MAADAKLEQILILFCRRHWPRYCSKGKQPALTTGSHCCDYCDNHI